MFDGKFGNFEVCFKINKSADCTRRIAIDTAVYGFSNSYRRVLFDFAKEPNQAKAEYTIEITTSNSSAGVHFGAIEVNDLSQGALFAKEIKAGMPVLDSLNAKNTAVYYSLHFPTIPSGTFQPLEAIQIVLTPISGSYILSVRNDDKTPTPENAMWKSFADEITITKEDPLYKEGAIYVVGVHPIVDGTDLDFKFQIKWTYTDKHNLLSPGIPDQGTLASSYQCFVAEMLPSYRNVLFAKGGHGDTDLYLSIGKHAHSPSQEFHDFHAKADETGLYITQEDINKHCTDNFQKKSHCNAYMCIHGKKNGKYSLAYSPNDMPFILNVGKTFHGPIPTGNKLIRFLYYPKIGSPVDIEEYTNNRAVAIVSKLSDQTQTYVWPIPAVSDSELSSANLIHYTFDELKNYTKPVVLITLGKHPRLASIPNLEFDFRNPFAIEAGFSIKELVIDSPRTVKLERGKWAYFYIYNSDPSATIYVGLDSLNSGDADMFISRGKDVRPSYSSYLAKSNGFRSTYMLVDSQIVRARHHTSMEGYYTVGVCANSDIHMSLSWGHASGMIIRPPFNVFQSVKVEPASSAKLILYNYMPGDIEILFNTHHQPLIVYWIVERPELNYKSNDMELFPSSDNHKLKWELSNLKGIQRLIIPESIPGFCIRCKHFLTFENTNRNEPISIQYRFGFKNQADRPETLPEDMVHFGVLERGESKPYHMFLPSTDEGAYKNYFIELQLVHGSGKVQLETKNRFTAQTSDAAIVEVHAGFNKITFENLGLDAKVVNGVYGLAAKVVSATLGCEQSCSYKIQLRRLQKYTDLLTNHPREAMLSTETDSESFLYRTTGKEDRFDITFTIEEFFKPEVKTLEAQDLRQLVEVFHIKDKSELNNVLTTKLKPSHEHADGLNNRLNLEFPPVQGFFVLIVRGSKVSGFKYRLEVSTKPIATIFPGRMSVHHIGKAYTNKTFELFPHQPGSIFIRIAKCFGDVDLFTSGESQPENFMSTPASSGRYTKVWDATEAGKQVYMMVKKSNVQATKQGHLFGYLDHTQNQTVFSFEAFEARTWSNVPFDLIKPVEQDVHIDLETSRPLVHFRPIEYPKDDNVKYSVRYFVVVSKDPEVVEYYASCDSAHLKKVLKPGFTVDEAVKVFALDPNIKLNHESTSLKPYHTAELDLESGHRYFLTLYGQVSISHPKNMPEAIASNALRVSYITVEFEYRSFFYPAELISATLGLIGLILMSCCVLNRKLFNKIKKRIGGGFRRVGENSDTNAVDQDLEEYFMRIKYEYDSAEKKRSSRDQSRADQSGLDNSQDVSSDQANEATLQDDSSMNQSGILSHDVTTVLEQPDHSSDNKDSKDVEKSIEMV